MTKPYLIVHTHTTLDGKINYVDTPSYQTASEQYQELALSKEKEVFGIKGYLNGRQSAMDNMDLYDTLPAVKDVELPEGDYTAKQDADMYYVALDRKGVLYWKENNLDYGNRETYVIEVLSELASDDYKRFLREKEISYIIAGEEQIDIELMLKKLKDLFGMDRIMIGGGGILNWSFIQSGLVDEVSVIVGPFANGDPDSASLFTAAEGLSDISPKEFELMEAKALEDSVVWLRYKVINDNQ